MDAPVRIENRAQLIYLLTEASEPEQVAAIRHLVREFGAIIDGVQQRGHR